MEIFRLMGICNNRCKFCMVEKEIAKENHPPFEDISSRILSLQDGDRIDLFGGEPTLYPFFWDLLELATHKNLRISMATNCRSMSSLSFVNRLKQFPIVEIRTSLYGHNPKIHDYYTSIKGSFRQTIRGIQNLCHQQIPPLVNIVLLEENVDHLQEMLDLLVTLGVSSIKLSSLYGNQQIKDMILDIGKVKKIISSAVLGISNRGISLQIEKSPLCLAPLFINFFIHETDPKMIHSSERNYTYPDICKECKLKKACDGVLKAYIEKYNTSGLTPYESIPPYAIREINYSEVADYSPQFSTEFISIDYQKGSYPVIKPKEKLKYINGIKKQYAHAYIIEKGEIIQ